MFSHSTHRRHWLFGDKSELETMRNEANAQYIQSRIVGDTGSKDLPFLNPKEESVIVKFYLYELKKLCKIFQPPMIKGVVGTAIQYFKRFYLENSCMQFDPRDIAVTCAYLACKVEEFNVSIDQFIANVKGDSDKAKFIVLSNEMLLMRKLKYHLIVHNPYRAVEGFLIDIKARSRVKDPESLRPHIDAFIDALQDSDSCFLYTPSQIALASIQNSIVKHCPEEVRHFDQYVSTFLFLADEEKISDFASSCIDLKTLADGSSTNQSDDYIKSLKKRLKKIMKVSESPGSQQQSL